MALSWEDLKILISKTRLKIPFLESHSDLPGANELSMYLYAFKRIYMHIGCQNLTLWVLRLERTGRKQLITMAADALAPCVARASAAMVLTLQDKRLQWRRISSTCGTSVMRNYRKWKQICFLNKSSAISLLFTEKQYHYVHILLYLTPVQRS